MGKQGKRISDAVRDLVIKTKSNAPALSYREIADRVQAAYGEEARIDKSSVGRILRPAGLGGPRSGGRPSRGVEPREPCERQEKLVKVFDTLAEAMWVPPPEQVPVGQYNNQIVAILGGQWFRCTRNGGNAVRCWVTEMEEQWLCATIPQACPGDIGQDLVRRYRELQAQMCDYIQKVTAYVLDYESGSGRVWFEELRQYAIPDRLELAKRSPFEYGEGFDLIEMSAGLYGQVDTFVRDFRLCLSRTVDAV